MISNTLFSRQIVTADVAAIVTAMTDDEQPFLLETLQAVLTDTGIGQILLCIEEHNSWLESTIGSHIQDPRLQILRLPMMPVGAVRNRAIQFVHKPWLAFCDGDDVWCKGKTQIQLTHAVQTGADLIGTGHYLTDERGRIRVCGVSRFIPMVSSWMVRTDIMKRYPFQEELPKGEDGNWWISTAPGIELAKCPELLLKYRVRTSSLSSQAFSKQRKLYLVMLAGVPILGHSLYFFSRILWQLTRHRPYQWMGKWNKC